MEERQVTVAGETHALPPLFLALATQNPIEQEGTYPLPETQMDRFLLYVNVPYPPAENEAAILRLVRGEKSGSAATSPPPVSQEIGAWLPGSVARRIKVVPQPSLQRCTDQPVATTTNNFLLKSLLGFEKRGLAVSFSKNR